MFEENGIVVGERVELTAAFFVYQGIAVLCRAECKGTDEDADNVKLGQTAYWAARWKEMHQVEIKEEGYAQDD